MTTLNNRMQRLCTSPRHCLKRSGTVCALLEPSSPTAVVSGLPLGEILWRGLGETPEHTRIKTEDAPADSSGPRMTEAFLDREAQLLTERCHVNHLNTKDTS